MTFTLSLPLARIPSGKFLLLPSVCALQTLSCIINNSNTKQDIPWCKMKKVPVVSTQCPVRERERPPCVWLHRYDDPRSLFTVTLSHTHAAGYLFAARLGSATNRERTKIHEKHVMCAFVVLHRTVRRPFQTMRAKCRRLSRLSAGAFF
jgi:hypothetical protein